MGISALGAMRLAYSHFDFSNRKTFKSDWEIVKLNQAQNKAIEWEIVNTTCSVSSQCRDREAPSLRSPLRQARWGAHQEHLRRCEELAP